MPTFYNKDSDNFIHATVVTSQKIIDLIGKDLPGHFFKHRVSLVSMSPALNFGSDAVTLILAGKENDIKASLGILKKICQGKFCGYFSTMFIEFNIYILEKTNHKT